jgi:ribosomal protein S18 acetylase RimI-like enzyme
LIDDVFGSQVSLNSILLRDVNMSSQIRFIEPLDHQPIIEFTRRTQFFRDWEIEALAEVLRDYQEGNWEYNHRGICFEQEGQIVGFAYAAPAEMTDRSWYLYWLVVDSDFQNQGIGKNLLNWIEEDLISFEARVLFVETSSLPLYDPTRKFYLARGYSQCAVLPDFYTDGDDMVVFVKKITKATK